MHLLLLPHISFALSLYSPSSRELVLDNPWYRVSILPPSIVSLWNCYMNPMAATLVSNSGAFNFDSLYSLGLIVKSHGEGCNRYQRSIKIYYLGWLCLEEEDKTMAVYKPGPQDRYLIDRMADSEKSNLKALNKLTSYTTGGQQHYRCGSHT
jgi:hypothetical protein